MAGVETIQLAKRFREVVALDGVSLTVADGGFTAILGPSGCGKTTLMRCLAGLQEPDAGVIRIGGTEVTRLAPHRRNLGMVFQKPSMFPHLTVAENIAWGLRLRGWRNATQVRDRTDDVLRLVRLEGMGGRRASELSGGQAQRVVIARALAPNPDLLLLDEPLSALDARLRAELLGEVVAIQRETRCTTILVTHDQAEAFAAASHLVLMDRGRIIQQGTPLEVFRRPETRFAATFIGAKNLIPGTLRRVDSGSAVDLTEVALRLDADYVPSSLRDGDPVWACLDADDIDILPADATAARNEILVKVVSAGFSSTAVTIDARLGPHPIRVHAGGSGRLALVESQPVELRCRPGLVVVIPRAPGDSDGATDGKE